MLRLPDHPFWRWPCRLVVFLALGLTGVSSAPRGDAVFAGSRVEPVIIRHGGASARLSSLRGEARALARRLKAQSGPKIDNVPPENAIFVETFGAVSDDGQDDSGAIQAAIDALLPGQVLFFRDGTYDVAAGLRRDGLQDVTLLGQGNAVIRKLSPFEGETIFQTRFSSGVTVANLRFIGLTPERERPRNLRGYWKDNGLYFGSTKGTVVESNEFRDMVAATRIATSPKDRKIGINSYDATVRRNYFSNIDQISTTNTGSSEHGGTSGYTVSENVFENLKGSAKAATRAEASNIVYSYNLIETREDGIVIAGYSDVKLIGNIIKPVGGHGCDQAIGISPTKTASKGYPLKGWNWSNKYVIRENLLFGCRAGIHFAMGQMDDGSIWDVEDLEVAENTFQDIVGDRPIIQFAGEHGNTLIRSRIVDNMFIDSNRDVYLRLPKSVEDVVVEGNISVDQE